MMLRIRLSGFLGLLFICTAGSGQNCAVYFNGVSSGAHVESVSTTVPNFTISFWFKAYGPGPMFSSSGDVNGSTGVGDKRIYIDGTGDLRAGVYSGGVQQINSNTMVLDSQCHHVAFCQSNSGTTLYIDGVFKGSSTYVSTDQTNTPPFYWVVGHEYMIGDWQPQPPTYFFRGDIDELTVWDKGFTASGVTDTLLQVNYCPADPELLWHVNFNNCSDTLTGSDARITDSLFYQNGVQPVTSDCPAAFQEITTGPVTGSPFCSGGVFSVPYTSEANFLYCNVFTVQLSDSSGNFGSPVDIGDSAGFAKNGSIYATIPPGTPPGSNYRVRVISSAPPAVGYPDTTSIIINANVTASVSISAPSLNNCSGIPVAFTAIPVNGGIPVYEWLKNGMVVGADSSSYTDSTPGNGDVISCVMIGNAGCGSLDTVSSNQLTISLNNVQAGVISAVKDTLCQGATAQLSVTGSVDSILQWQSSILPDSFTDITGADTSIYEAPLMQNTVFRVVVSSGSCTDTSAPFNLTVYPVPVPVLTASDTLICASDSARVSTTRPFSTYQWNTGDTTDHTYAHDAGGYWVTVSDANSCTAISGHIEITVYPVPSVSIIVQGDTLSSFGTVNYQWLFDGNAIPGATTNIYVAKQTGDYSLLVTDSNGCTSISTSTHVIVNGLTDIYSNDQWMLYPNPASSQVYVSLTGSTGLAKIRVVNMAGQEVMVVPVEAGKNSLIPIDISKLPPGVYELMYADEMRVLNARVLKE